MEEAVLSMKYILFSELLELPWSVMVRVDGIASVLIIFLLL